MEKKNLVKSILVIVMDIIVYKLFGKIVDYFQLSEMLNRFVAELFFAAIAIHSLFILNRQDILKFTFKGFFEGLAVGAYTVTGIVLGILSLALNHPEIRLQTVLIRFLLLTLLQSFYDQLLISIY